VSNYESFNLVAEHADFLVIAKAPGVSFHSEDGAGVVVQVEQALGMKLYPVHRLDKVTSGLLILARSSAAAAEFTELFSRHQIQKYYLALSLDKPKQKQGWVKGDMAPARRGAYKLLSSMENPAVSYFISAGFQQSAALPVGCRAFLIKPFTGKTHQIRVALKSMAAAIAGDDLYQGKTADRVYLHAYGLDFVWRGQHYQYILPPSHGQWFTASELQDLLSSQWATPWLLAFPAYQLPIR
jgi:tRNA pseudouridine32 synthase/23S rRNA pseudouridine746 synthase